MIPLTIRSIGRYHRVERMCQLFHETGVNLSLGGLEYCRLLDPEGRVVWDAPPDRPFLGLILPGMRSDFSYGPERDNWVAMVEGLPLRWGRRPGDVEIGWGEDWFAVPIRFSLSRVQAEALSHRFARLARAFRAPTPSARFLAQADLLAVLAPFVESLETKSTETPAERLKGLVDAEPGSRDTFAHLAGRCGYSPDHLRRLFLERYHTTPRAYRLHARAAFAMDLLAHTDATVAEVAEQAGYDHPAHFARAFRAVYGLTPRDAIRRYRFGLPAEPMVD